MPPRMHQVTGAMFDVKPVTPAGRVDVSKVRSVFKRLNLRNAEPTKVPLALARVDSIEEEVKEIALTSTLLVAGAVLAKDDALRELEAEFVPALQPRVVPIASPVLAANPNDPPFEKIVAEVRRSQRLSVRNDPVAPTPPVQVRKVARLNVPPAAVRTRASQMRLQEVDTWYHAPALATAPAAAMARPLAAQYAHVMPTVTTHPAVPSIARRSRWFSFQTVIAGIVAFVILAGGSFVFSLKRQVIENGTAALHSLEAAQNDLARFDFDGASSNFAQAYDAFTSASGRLDDLGSNITSWVSELPGGQALESAQHITKVGALIADTGKAMAQAVSAMSKTGFLLNPQSNSRFLLSEVLGPLKEALALSDKNLSQAGLLLQDVDDSIIPQEKRPAFETFKEKLPTIAGVVKDGQDYVQFLESFMGVHGKRRYLILFQNTTELRPTGGFPGNYGVITVENGKVKDILVDDVYDIDGQLKEMIVPPKQLQHITPTWGMRDTNWFIDFPTSARKAMALFRKEAGYDVDGVITITPKILQDILKIVGPIDLPAYHLTITGENFLPEIQNEVEYGENKKINQPKKIVADLAPLILERLYSAPPSTWLTIFQGLVANVEQKEMIMYFRESGLEDLVLKKGFGGQVSATNDDYLMVTASNIKGAKTDAVTDSLVSMTVQDKPEGLHHTLRITRIHNGGKSEHGFYNVRNPSFMRVLVPQGAKLGRVTGASIVSYKPLLDYSQKGFIRDPDLQKLEDTFQTDEQSQVSTYEEAGKTGFGFWMVLEPGTTQTVEVEYTVPQLHMNDTYRMLVQKQPGLVVKSFDFHLIPPAGAKVTAAAPVLHETGGEYIFSKPLEKDLTIQAQVQRP